MFGKQQNKSVASAPAAPAFKRNYFRVSLRSRIQLHAGGVAVPFPALVMDLSGGGCQVCSRISIEPGQPVQFNLPRADATSALRLSGIVRSKRYSEQDRIYFYGVGFNTLTQQDQETLLQEITLFQRKLIMQQRGEKQTQPLKTATLLKSGKAQPKQERGAFRVAWPFPLTYTVTGIAGARRGTSLDISAGGMRLATDMVLREDWILTLSFTLPDAVLDALQHTEEEDASPLFGTRYPQKTKVIKQRPFPPLTIQAKIVPGVSEQNGRHVHGLIFKEPDHLFKEEIMRFVHAAQLMLRRMAV